MRARLCTGRLSHHYGPGLSYFLLSSPQSVWILHYRKSVQIQISFQADYLSPVNFIIAMRVSTHGQRHNGSNLVVTLLTVLKWIPKTCVISRLDFLWCKAYECLVDKCASLVSCFSALRLIHLRGWNIWNHNSAVLLRKAVKHNEQGVLLPPYNRDSPLLKSW